MRALTALLVAAGIVVPAARAYAQIDFTGAWTLDRDISADLAKATFEPPPDQARRSPGGFSGGFGGRGGGGGRMGGGGRPRSGGGGADSAARGGATLTVEERTRLREIAAYVKGLTSLVIEHSDHATFAVTDAQGRSRVFPTDGTPVEHAFATMTIGSATKWDGPHLVTTYRIGPDRDLLFTYILVPATKQLALRITLDEGGRRRADVPELRLIYKMTPAHTSSPKSD